MKHNGQRGRNYFSRAPLHSYQFWVVTAFLLMVTAEALFYLTRFGERLGGEAIIWMIFPVFVLAGLWFRVLRTHQNVFRACHSEYHDGRQDHAVEEAKVDILLDNLAYLSYAGFALASVAACFLYVALAQAVTALTR